MDLFCAVVEVQGRSILLEGRNEVYKLQKLNSVLKLYPWQSGHDFRYHHQQIAILILVCEPW
jgi:hypothetical protein